MPININKMTDGNFTKNVEAIMQLSPREKDKLLIARIGSGSRPKEKKSWCKA